MPDIEVNGEVDASWSSYYDAEENGTQTVSGTTEDDGGEVEFEFLPSDVDPDDLSTARKRALKVAAMHRPDSLSQLAEMSGVSRLTCRRALRDHAPDLYTDVRDSSADPDSIDDSGSSTSETDENALDDDFEPGASDDADDESPPEMRVDASDVSEALVFAERVRRVHDDDEMGRLAETFIDILRGERA